MNVKPAPLRSEDLYQALKRTGAFDEGDDSIYAFHISARVGELVTMTVERRPRADELEPAIETFVLEKVDTTVREAAPE